jgi:hypothetical protein
MPVDRPAVGAVVVLLGLAFVVITIVVVMIAVMIPIILTSKYKLARSVAMRPTSGPANPVKIAVNYRVTNHDGAFSCVVNFELYGEISREAHTQLIFIVTFDGLWFVW